MPQSARPGDVLADRYLLVDLLTESGSGRFWRAHDRVLERHVALHCLDADDPLAEQMMEAARLSATVHDRRLLRVLDADRDDHTSYVVHEWGSGTSLDILVQAEGPLPPRRAAWIVSEVAEALVPAHEQRVAHGRLNPENVLIDQSGQVRLIGFCVDAALMGLPTGRVSDDVTDVVGLLYFLLTGRWAGVAESAMPEAMREHGKHGRWLRPRQVRAGIPRVLDGICDQVLNPFDASSPGNGGSNVHTVRGLVEALREYVGDPADLVQPAPLGGVAGAGALAVPQRRAPGEPRDQPDPEATATLPVAPVVPPSPAPAAEAEPPPTVSSPDETPTGEQSPVNVPPPPVDSPVDVPTQAGMPIFDDEADDVSWLERRSEPPPPPPAFEEPPERPLFAPDPEDGGPARRPRPGAAAPTGSEYWPWESTGPGTGSGVIPVTEDPDEEEVPGRSWFRLGGLALLSLLLVLAIVVAYNLGRGRTLLGAVPEDEATSSSPTRTADPTPEPITGLTATAIDPQSDDGEENSDLAPLAVDGDPATAWRTSTYFDQLGPPPGLKTGVGLVVDLGESREFSQIDLTTIGSPTGVSYFVSDSAPTAVAGLERIATGTTEGDALSTTLDEPVTGQYLVVWLTALPDVGGDFRGEVAEVVVSG